MKSNGRRMLLNRETLRTLSPDQLGDAAGGTTVFNSVRCGNVNTTLRGESVSGYGPQCQSLALSASNYGNPP